MDVVVDLGVYGPDGFTTTKRDQIPTIEPALEQSTIGSLARTYKDYELVIHPGDFAYADDWFLKPQNLLDGKDAYQAILETFYDNQLAPITQIKPYMASPGNHEAACEEINYTTGLCPQGQMNFTDYRNRFNQTFGTAFLSSSNNTNAKAAATMAKALANPPFWYSFEYGQAHVVMFNTETDFPKAPDGKNGSANLNAGPFGATGQQLAFLEADLSSVDRSVTPWLIVAGHRPWYSTGGSDNICAPCQAAFEPLFYKYGVDLALFGHVHNSQRFNPIYNGTVDPAGLNNPKAPMYVVAGGAGNIEGLSSTGANATGNVFAYDGDFSYGRVKVLDANNLGIEFYNSRNDTLLDSSVLYKAHGQQFVVQ
jgi:acid phosphatase